MADLKNPRVIWLKGGLFLLLGTLAGGLLLYEAPSLRVGLLLAICVWACCRAYYFAFYVIQRYVDDNYRFAGLIDFAKYCFRKRG